MNLQSHPLAILSFSYVISSSFFPIVFVTPLFAHPGGRDAYGCHHDRKHGGYHCHSGPFAGQFFSSQTEMLSSTKTTQNSLVTPLTKSMGDLPNAIPEAGGESAQVCIREYRTRQIMCGEPVR